MVWVAVEGGVAHKAGLLMFYKDSNKTTLLELT